MSKYWIPHYSREHVRIHASNHLLQSIVTRTSPFRSINRLTGPNFAPGNTAIVRLALVQGHIIWDVIYDL